ncbi:Hypothetical predicted protein [Olea europaea subsp. europaea]|uniref:Uncharacterized protein n=2 Tax=Olea europaea subsp. europaea TaxID=158383 RepID=A0A8S0RB90_OLEEU|nr:Hypothetical predicted protein [Olea europaea subsp. europaea]
MGLLSCFNKRKEKNGKEDDSKGQKKNEKPVDGSKGEAEAKPSAYVDAMSFGSAASSEAKATLVGYCPVSITREIEPCTWAVHPSEDPVAPQFFIVF